MSVRQYLINLKKVLAQKSLKSPFHVVTGNQSADMDSVISSIAFAYLSHNLVTPFNTIIPIINIPRGDFKLRKDIVRLLETHNITEDLLYFVEDYDNIIASSGTTPISLNLVDHNGLQGYEINKSYEEGMVNVVGIIDHHADENKFLDANPRVIRTCGSNSSLVFQHFFELFKTNDKFWYDNTELVGLLLGPLLIDTSNMTQKVEEPDLFAIKEYKNILNNSSSTSQEISGMTNFYSALKTAKKDMSGFSFGDVLKKDYKQFKFANGENVGFSSIGKSIKWVFSNYSKDEVNKTLSDTLKLNKIDLLVITSSYTQKENDKYTREFCFYYEGVNEQFAKLASLVTDQLNLNDDLYGKSKISPVSQFVNAIDGHHLEIYNQINIKASRKQVVPIVKAVLEK